MGMGLHVRGKGAEEVSNPAQRRRCRPWSGPISDLFLGVRVARVTNNSKTVVFPTGERLFAKFHTVMRRHTSLQSQKGLTAPDAAPERQGKIIEPNWRCGHVKRRMQASSETAKEQQESCLAMRVDKVAVRPGPNVFNNINPGACQGVFQSPVDQPFSA